MTRLAREFHCSIEEIGQLDGAEADEWKHHFTKYPFTIDLLDEHFAQLTYAVVSCMGTGKKKWKLEDFLLIRRGKKRLPKTEAEFKATLGG